MALQMRLGMGLQMWAGNGPWHWAGYRTETGHGAFIEIMIEAKIFVRQSPTQSSVTSLRPSYAQPHVQSNAHFHYWGGGWG